MRLLGFLCALLVSLSVSAQGLENYVESDFIANMGKNEKAAVLMVHFGTTHDDTRSRTIDAINNKVAQLFPAIELREAFTSRIIIKRLAARGIVKKTPLEALMQLRSEGFTRVLVQSTNIIVGSEYESLLKDVEQMNSFFRDIRVGQPLLSTAEDVEQVVDILAKRNLRADKLASKKLKTNDTHILFVGHGTESSATAIYAMADYMFKDKGYINCHVATIEGYPSFDNVLKQLKAQKAHNVVLVPFMFVAGDHAKNDISGDWREELEKQGFKVLLNIEGLGQIPEIQDIFVQHLAKMMTSRERSIMEKKAEYSL